MRVVDLLELVRRLRIVGILVRVELQCQFPEKGGGGELTITACLSAAHRAGSGQDVSPVRPLDVVRRGYFLNSQHVVERLASGGQGALPLVLSHDLSLRQTDCQCCHNTNISYFDIGVQLHVKNNY